jgi:hypothetical protein
VPRVRGSIHTVEAQSLAVTSVTCTHDTTRKLNTKEYSEITNRKCSERQNIFLSLELRNSGDILY